MYVHSVKLINFKSIGDYPESEVILEPMITAIIGKNESGKSNVLDGLSRINFIKRNPMSFISDIVNRNNTFGTENSYIITLKPLPKEIEKGFKENTQITITKDRCVVSGGFFEYCRQNVMPVFEMIVNTLNEIGANPFQVKDLELVSYKNCKEELMQKETLNLYAKTSAVEFLCAHVGRIAVEYKDKVEKILSDAKNMWSNLLDMFPVFFYRKSDKHLNTLYKIEDIEKELKNPKTAPNSLLYDFVNLIGISINDFILAARAGTSSIQETLRRKIN